jgi:hypothetical protein
VGNDQGRQALLQGSMREEREQQLQQLLKTRKGRIQLWLLFTNYCRTAEGRRLPPSGSVMIQTILSNEFPASALGRD